MYRGKRMDTQKYCGVSVLRAGETMEPAICEVCKDIRLGKILIQTNNDTGEPEVSYKTSITVWKLLLKVAIAACPSPGADDSGTHMEQHFAPAIGVLFQRFKSSGECHFSFKVWRN